MARTRTVSTAEILDAAERVVMQLGAVGLSLDAVAKECGISKTRVVYDYKTKNALIEALIERRFKLDVEKIDAMVRAAKGAEHPELMGRIKHAETMPDEVDKAVAVAITVAMSQNENIQKIVRHMVERDFAAMESGARPHAARMAHLALMGFCFHEWLNLKKWQPEERMRLLADIAAVYTSFPDGVK